MASESSDEVGLSVSLPVEIDEWLDAKAAELEVDRETVVVQLFAAYRAAGELGDTSVESALTDGVEDEVSAVMAERIPEIAAAVEEEIEVGEDAETVENRLTEEVDRLETDFREKLQDVRDRVVQVKRETDSKAPGDHTHPEFGELAGLSQEVDELGDRLNDLSAAVNAAGDERQELADRVAQLEDLDERMENAEEKLRTVAWVVSDLRETVATQGGQSRAIDRLKQSAAQADIDRALCENCDEPVDIALLSEPTCPHCDATFGDVESPSGLFGKPRLSVAKQLESGTGDEAADVPNAATRNV